MTTTILRFSAAHNIGSKVIQIATWGDYSHVDFETPEGKWLGARFVGGVDEREPYEVARYIRFEVPDAPTSVLERLRTQLHRPYDYLALVGFVARQDWRIDDSWICSELMAWAFEQENFPLLRGDRFNRITPRDLMLSTRLRFLDKWGV